MTKNFVRGNSEKFLKISEKNFDNFEKKNLQLTFDHHFHEKDCCENMI